MTWTKELDEATVLATRSGYWHVLLFYLLCGLAAFPTSFLVFSQVFTNGTPDHWCAPPPELEALGLSDTLLRSLLVPGGHGAWEKCKSYDVTISALYEKLDVQERPETVYFNGENHTIRTRKLTPLQHEEPGRSEQIERIKEVILANRSEKATPCGFGWRFNNTHYKRTLVTDFSLYCDEEGLPRLSNILFWVGSIFGNLFFGWMSDRYGRRPSILLMIFLEVPLAIAASFTTSYWAYTVLRVAGGLFFPALYQLPFILALELMPPNRRTYAGIVVGMLFACGMCLLSLLAYIFQDWFHLSLATSVPFVLLYSYYWLLPESPRWLVGRGRIAEAEKVLKNLASKNGITLQRGFLLELHKKIKDEEDSAEAAMLTNINGHVANMEERDTDRRISNMLTFRPDLSRIEEAKPESIERVIALEVAEIVNKKTRRRTESAKDSEAFDVNEEGVLNADSLQKSTQTDFPKSPASTLRRKSWQLVSKMFVQEEEEDVMENKKMDEENSEGDCKASPLDVFRYPNIRRKFFLLTFEWVALGVVYNSLSYNTSNLGVDDYLAFFIGGVVELPSYVLAWWCMDRYGRRWVLCIFMIIGGLACLSCGMVPEEWPWITVSFSMLGRLCAASSFAVFYVLIGELLPTVLRAQVMGAASFIAGLGLLACPYIVHLAAYSRALPLTIIGTLSVLGGVVSLLLPETLNQPLPQTLDDGEMFGRDFKIFSCVERQKPRHLAECD